MIPETLISIPYLREQVILHARKGGYGGKGGKWAGEVVRIAQELHARSVLDYGCGQGSLAEALRAAPAGLDVREYDPAIIGKDILPDPADLVVCTDVIEHIEADKLHNVLTHLKSLAKIAAFVVIATRPSGKFLSDGRNAHLTVMDAMWWSKQVQQAGFTITPIQVTSPEAKPSREWVAVLTP